MGGVYSDYINYVIDPYHLDNSEGAYPSGIENARKQAVKGMVLSQDAMPLVGDVPRKTVRELAWEKTDPASFSVTQRKCARIDTLRDRSLKIVAIATLIVIFVAAILITAPLTFPAILTCAVAFGAAVGLYGYSAYLSRGGEAKRLLREVAAEAIEEAQEFYTYGPYYQILQNSEYKEHLKVISGAEEEEDDLRDQITATAEGLYPSKLIVPARVAQGIFMARSGVAKEGIVTAIFQGRSNDRHLKAYREELERRLKALDDAPPAPAP